MKCTPRLEINLDKVYHNAHVLVQRLDNLGISVTGVTKSTLGSIDIANILIRAGVSSLGDSRIENIAAMRQADVNSVLTLIRSPMISQADAVVKHADISFNTELAVIRQLSVSARKASRVHRVVLMVELGDLREGILPQDMLVIVKAVCCLPYIALDGIGTNLACRSGVSPDEANMTALTELAKSIERKTGRSLEMVSGGNSANLNWAFSVVNTGRINNLRLGESILLGRETLHRQPITGLYTDAISLVAEVIESKQKPLQSSGVIAQSAFGKKHPVKRHGNVLQTILALGIQDVDPDGLQTAEGIRISGASSDHLILESENHDLPVGSEISFQLDYSALLRAMTSPFVTKVYEGFTGSKSNHAKPHQLVVA